jgi:hypothetical protein
MQFNKHDPVRTYGNKFVARNVATHLAPDPEKLAGCSTYAAGIEKTCGDRGASFLT